MFKNFIFAIALLCATISSRAQLVGAAPPYEEWTQWLNISNVYNGLVAYGTQWTGGQWDTVGTSGNLVIQSSRMYVWPGSSSPTKNPYGRVNVDTVITWPIFSSNGKNCLMTVQVACYQASYVTTVSPTLVATLQQSNDGTNFAAVPGATVFTLTPTYASNKQTGGKSIGCAWNVSDVFARYMAVSFVATSAADSAAVQVTADLKRPFTYQKQP